MSTIIEVQDNVQVITITVVDEDNTVTLQPVINRSGGTQNLQQVTEEGATTDVLTTFEGGLRVGNETLGVIDFKPSTPFTNSIVYDGSDTGVLVILSNSIVIAAGSASIQVDENGIKFFTGTPPSIGQVLAATNALGQVEWTTVSGGASPLTTKGDVYTYSTEDARLPVGTNGQVLSADSAEATGLKWVDASGGNETIVTDATVSGTYNIDWSNEAYYLTLTGATTLTESNLPSAGETKTMKLFITGDYPLTLPADWDFDLKGEYAGNYLNRFTVDYLEATEYVTKISIPYSQNIIPDPNFDTPTYYTVSSGFTIASNKATYDGLEAIGTLTTNIKETVYIGDVISISFTISDLVGIDLARLNFRAPLSSLNSYVNYANGNHVVEITNTVANFMEAIRVYARNDNGGGSFSISNFNVRKKI
jgi:hypothetical protein